MSDTPVALWLAIVYGFVGIGFGMKVLADAHPMDVIEALTNAATAIVIAALWPSVIVYHLIGRATR